MSIKDDRRRATPRVYILFAMPIILGAAGPASSASPQARKTVHAARKTAHPKMTATSTAAANLKPITSPVRLSYSYKVGDVRRYKVTGFFSGHFPPFASAGSPPIHLMTVLDYVATVKKVTDKGAEVDFNVENADLSLLEEEPGADGKIDPDKTAPFPIPLSQVQKMFNAVATFKPNGEVASIQGGDSSTVKIDLGIDLRKLFLVTEPITLADAPVKTGDTWPFKDGLLGSKAGKTTYTGRLEAISGNGKDVAAKLTQQADSVVDSKLDKEGNSTDSTDQAVGSLVGKVTLTGVSNLVGATEAAPNGNQAAGHVTTADMSMVAQLKRTLPDPDQAGKQIVTDIDITAHLFVKPAANTPSGAAKAKQSADGATGVTPKPPKTAKVTK